MVLGSAGLDRKEFPKSNLHVGDRGDTKTGIYNMERCTKKKKMILDCDSWIILLFKQDNIKNKKK